MTRPSGPVPRPDAPRVSIHHLRTAPTTSLAWQWQAIGTTWRIHHDGCVDNGLAELAAAAVERDEARWSRFRPASEVSRLNDAAGTDVAVSLQTLDLLAACIRWQEATDGVFDPLVAANATQPFSRIELDRAAGTARIPRGTRLDLGGIAKGWIADRAARLLREEQPHGRILVDAGGDLVAAGGSHLVAIDGEPHVWLPLDEGDAVATAALRATATVVAASATEADVLARTLALRPERLAALRRAALVRAHGTPRTTPAWDALAAGPEGERAA